MFAPNRGCIGAGVRGRCSRNEFPWCSWIGAFEGFLKVINTPRSEASLGKSPDTYRKFLDDVRLTQKVVGIGTAYHKTVVTWPRIGRFSKSTTGKNDNQ